MSELTRGEIRGACEAVPEWKWREGDGGDVSVEDAFDLLEAWRSSGSEGDPGEDVFEYGVDRGLNKDGSLVFSVTLREREPGRLVIPRTLARRDDPTLPEAAARAVLAWAEAKEAKG